MPFLFSSPLNATAQRKHPMSRTSSSETPSRAFDDAGLPVVRVGFMPLADCAPLVMASLLGFDVRHGVRLVLTREASWAGVRDKLLSGDLDMAHVLYGLVYGVHAGIGVRATDMAVLMTLNRNGQGISLSRQLAEKGAVNLDSLVALMRREPRPYTFAQTFPTGTHAMWLYYWLASVGVHPMQDVKTIVVPPPQMVSSAREGLMDGFSVGEPWNHRGMAEGVSVHAAASQDIWPDHPEKVLGATAKFVDERPELARATICAVLEACRWLDATHNNRERAALAISSRSVINAAMDTVVERLCGHYRDGRGREWNDPHPVTFFADGDVNFPWLSDGMWFLTQHKRWGLLDEHPDYLAMARAINRIDLYRDAAAEVQVSVPRGSLRSSELMDGRIWDGSDPAGYADGFALDATTKESSSA